MIVFNSLKFTYFIELLPKCLFICGLIFLSRGAFIKAVKKRRVYFATVKQKDQKWEDHLREFLKKDVLPMWENGWMKVVSLMDILSKMEPDVLHFKPVSKSMNPRYVKCS